MPTSLSCATRKAKQLLVPVNLIWKQPQFFLDQQIDIYLLYLSHIKQTQHTQLILLKAKINFLICSVPSTRLTYHVCLLYHLKKMKCSSDTELSKYKGKILSCPQKCPEENLNYEINLVLYRHSAICFLLCIKYS